MTDGRQPPALLVKTLGVTFGMVALLLLIVFIVVFATLRSQVRTSVSATLESTQSLFSELEERRQRDLRAQAETVAENSTLKAAVDTYIAEARASDNAAGEQLLTTIARELEKVAARVESDALVVVDLHQQTLAAAGPFADRWPRGRAAMLAPTAEDTRGYEEIARVGGHLFRVVTVPLTLGDAPIGALYLAAIVDADLAAELDRLSRSRIAIVSQNQLVATTLDREAAVTFAASPLANEADGTVSLAGEMFAFRRLVQVGDTSFYALASIDEFSRAGMGDTVSSLAFIAVGAGLLALVVSFSLARSLSRPIGHLSAALAHMAETHHVDGRLALTGSSRELDTLTKTFNDLMATVAEAEAQTEAAYTGAIRALAAALDARDPYTAGHSERVSAVSVAIGRELGLEHEALEILRLGALLHDIGKIGVPDEVLRKPGALTNAEYDTIKQHPVLGARILRSVPFLAKHLAIVELHHERPDGRGYPYGLRGDDIPLPARIVHVADAYDAMTSARAYRGALPSDDALRELWRCAGAEFHREIVGALATALAGVTTPAPEDTFEVVGG
jgi:putative nucleotidyltransferase with HDIG domain